MILSLIVIVFWGLLAFIWASRGFYSALINMVCTLIAGAIAFGTWELVGYQILNAAPARGTFAWVEGAAWALGLALPFVLSLALLRLLTDTVLRANVAVSTTVNYAGAGICSLVSTTIVMGVLVLSLGQQRYGKELFGWQPVTYNPNGSITRQGGLWLPVDRLTAGLYSHLSTTSFRTKTPLAKFHPEYDLVGPSLRMTFEGSNRTTARPEHVTLVGRFTAKSPKSSIDDLLSDGQSAGKQNITKLDGTNFPPATRIEGFVLRITSGAAEGNSGKLNVGNAQVRLVAYDERTKKSEAFHPLAVASQADAGSNAFGRWRYDSMDTFIASVGGSSEAVMSFEFPVPEGMKPIALYFKGARIPFDSAVEPTVIAMGPGMRDSIQAAPAASLGAGSGGAVDVNNLDTSKATTVVIGRNGENPEGIRIGPSIPFTLQEGLHAPLEIDDKRVVRQGEATWSKKDVDQMQQVDRALRIETFHVESDTTLVQVVASGDTAFSFLGGVISTLTSRDVPILLIDDTGKSYAPIGLVYQDDLKVTIRYTPGQPIRTISQIDATNSISRSRPSQRLTLLFRVSKGVKIRYYTAGEKVVAEFSPVMPTTR